MVPKMPNLSLTPLKPSCHPQHDIREAVLKYAIALLNNEWDLQAHRLIPMQHFNREVFQVSLFIFLPLGRD